MSGPNPYTRYLEELGNGLFPYAPASYEHRTIVLLVLNIACLFASLALIVIQTVESSRKQTPLWIYKHVGRPTGRYLILNSRFLVGVGTLLNNITGIVLLYAHWGAWFGQHNSTLLVIMLCLSPVPILLYAWTVTIGLVQSYVFVHLSPSMENIISARLSNTVFWVGTILYGPLLMTSGLAGVVYGARVSPACDALRVVLQELEHRYNSGISILLPEMLKLASLRDEALLHKSNFLVVGAVLCCYCSALSLILPGLGVFGLGFTKLLNTSVESQVERLRETLALSLDADTVNERLDEILMPKADTHVWETQLRSLLSRRSSHSLFGLNSFHPVNSGQSAMLNPLIPQQANQILSLLKTIADMNYIFTFMIFTSTVSAALVVYLGVLMATGLMPTLRWPLFELAIVGYYWAFVLPSIMLVSFLAWNQFWGLPPPSRLRAGSSHTHTSSTSSVSISGVKESNRPQKDNGHFEDFLHMDGITHKDDFEFTTMSKEKEEYGV